MRALSFAWDYVTVKVDLSSIDSYAAPKVGVNTNVTSASVVELASNLDVQLRFNRNYSWLACRLFTKI